MLLPDSLKAHLSQKFGIKADAPEQEFVKLLGEAGQRRTHPRGNGRQVDRPQW